MDVDSPAYSPIETVVFNKDTLRYETTEPNLVEDDFILQALVMWNLYRMDKAFGVAKGLQELSVYNGKRDASIKKLQNLWASEITPQSVGKGLNHHDNFDAFHRFYE